MYQQNNVIYAPVDSDKVFIRAIISKTEAQKLVETVPEICNKALDVQGEEDYRAMLESHSCNELLELAIKIYSKKQAVKKAKKAWFY